MDILDSWKSLVALVVLTSVAVVGMVWIHKLRKDAEGEHEDDSQEVYTALKRAYESGQMADSEFERVRASLDVPTDRWPELKRSKPASSPPEPFEKPAPTEEAGG